MFFIAFMLLNSPGSIHQGHGKLPRYSWDLLVEGEVRSILNRSAGIAQALGLSWNVKRHTKHTIYN